MSGGSMDYLCYKVKDEATDLLKSKIPHRKAFGNLLKLVAEALHAIEWHDSGDSGEDEEIEAVMKCITDKQVLAASLEQAKEILEELKHCIEKCEKSGCS